MNINKYNGDVPFEFEWQTIADGQPVTESVSGTVKRISLGINIKQETIDAITSGDTEALAQILSKLIASWNLDADGEPFEPTFENISALPIEFSSVLAEKVLAVISPNPTNANDSDNGSALATNSSAGSTADSQTATA